VRLGAGSFAYYPSGQHHTIRNASRAPVTYLMFKWLAGDSRNVQPLGATVVHAASVRVPDGTRHFRTALLLEGATAYLGRLHVHLSLVAPGGGYEPHADAHDVAIVLLKGSIETLGRRVEGPAVIYCSAGSMHGLKALGGEDARYLVFEFHARGGDLARGARLMRRCRWAVQKAVGRAKRVARRVRA
jgi:quercetin dioxygenase-like cupin family protein